MKRLFTSRYALIGVLIVFFIGLSLVTRLALLLSIEASGLSLGQGMGAFGIGIVYDAAVAAFVIIPFVLQIWWRNDFVYRPDTFPFVVMFFVLAILALLFTGVVPRDFSPELHTALVLYVGLRFGILLALYWLPKRFRVAWRKGVLYVFFFLAVFLLLFNAVSEWFFWQEFSSRYNFIAVDYLVYTTEVLGNITESYPLGAIISAVAVVAWLVVYVSRRPVQRSAVTPMPFGRRSLVGVVCLLLPLLVWVGVPSTWRHFSRNEYANSLAGNGLYEFAVAFGQNELDFFKYYQTIDDKAGFALLRQHLQTPHAQFVNDDPYSIERTISYPSPARNWNVVLISVESLSADFMKAFGNQEGITPYLDSLAPHSLFFTNLYASGTRTVRGLEALSLSIPPTPGQSIVKRPDNDSLFSIGSVLRSRGYITQYLYGGYSYFDNMKDFFSKNGYEVIDRSAIPANKVHYQNIWGVADEDLFSLALHVLDSNHRSGRPFFSQIMTVSNHRPYTYPPGRIDISPDQQIRQGAVKYTDYAINQFLRQAQAKPWFDSTLFVIVADHCAGSAGSVELPVTGYHIPMLIYAPKLLTPQTVTALTAQIDVVPTILGLLQGSYRSKFFGQDVFDVREDQQRAFISTYQGLGYLRQGQLIIQSPVKQVKAYVPDFNTGAARPVPANDTLAREAIAWYQSISWLLKHHRQSYP